jgi:hypothetical protein
MCDDTRLFYTIFVQHHEIGVKSLIINVAHAPGVLFLFSVFFVFCRSEKCFRWLKKNYERGKISQPPVILWCLIGEASVRLRNLAYFFDPNPSFDVVG